MDILSWSVVIWMFLQRRFVSRQCFDSYLVVVEREHSKIHVRSRECCAEHSQAQRNPLVLFPVQVARLRWWQLCVNIYPQKRKEQRKMVGCKRKENSWKTRP